MIEWLLLLMIVRSLKCIYRKWLRLVRQLQQQQPRHQHIPSPSNTNVPQQHPLYQNQNQNMESKKHVNEAKEKANEKDETKEDSRLHQISSSQVMVMILQLLFGMGDDAGKFWGQVLIPSIQVLLSLDYFFLH